MRAPVLGAVAVDADGVYVATVGEAHAGEVILDPSNGEERWRTDDDTVRGNVVSAPALSDGRIFVLEPGFVLALDAADGEPLWRSEVAERWRASADFARQGIGALAPVSADGQVVAVDVTGRVYAFDAATGVPTWDQALNDASTLGPPVLTGDQVLVPANSGTLYAVDRASVTSSHGSRPARRCCAGSPTAATLVAVAGFEDPRLLAFGEDPAAR